MAPWGADLLKQNVTVSLRLLLGSHVWYLTTETALDSHQELGAMQDHPVGVSAEVGGRMPSSPLWASPCHLQVLSCIKCLSPSPATCLTESFLHRCYGPFLLAAVYHRFLSLQLDKHRGGNTNNQCTFFYCYCCAEPPSPLACAMSVASQQSPCFCSGPSLLSIPPHPQASEGSC